ncbi:MAG: oligopeptide ABC transporter permease [Chloroflexota bacterium]
MVHVTPTPEPVPRADEPERPAVIRGPVRLALRRYARHRTAMAGALIIIIFALLAVGAPLVARANPDTIDLLSLNQGPSFQHLFGTDAVGRDTFARTLYAGRISLTVGLVAALIATTIGAVLGSMAGFVGGGVDNLIMRAVDVIMTFPPIVILLTVAAIVGPGIYTTMLIIGLLSWPIPCRLIRAKFLVVREQEYIQAARAIGVPTRRIIARHAFPNASDVLIVYASLSVANAVVLEAGLSFLGLGVQLPTPSWGNMLNVARDVAVLEGYPWQWVPAGVAIVLTVLAINFIGDGLRDALDPRMIS